MILISFKSVVIFADFFLISQYDNAFERNEDPVIGILKWTNFSVSYQIFPAVETERRLSLSYILKILSGVDKEHFRVYVDLALKLLTQRNSYSHNSQKKMSKLFKQLWDWLRKGYDNNKTCNIRKMCHIRLLWCW